MSDRPSVEELRTAADILERQALVLRKRSRTVRLTQSYTPTKPLQINLPLLLPTPTTRDGKGPNQRQDDTCLHGALLPTPAASDGARGPDYQRRNREGCGTDDLVTTAVEAVATQSWGKYEPAIRRWETLTRSAPSPTEPNSKGNPRLAAAFPEWMQGWPDGWVTDPEIGISRNDQLRCIGNGVCPQQAVYALRWLLDVAALAVAS